MLDIPTAAFSHMPTWSHACPLKLTRKKGTIETAVNKNYHARTIPAQRLARDVYSHHRLKDIICECWKEQDQNEEQHGSEGIWRCWQAVGLSFCSGTLEDFLNEKAVCLSAQRNKNMCTHFHKQTEFLQQTWITGF